MRQKLISLTRLMDESGRCLEAMARSGESQDSQTAARVLESPRIWVLWESEHQRLMHGVAVQRRQRSQLRAMRSAALSLIHRKSLFDYLRLGRVTGERRHRLLALFYGPTDYAQSVVAEHARYLRTACSDLCARHVGARLLDDAIFGEPLQYYEELYREYFAAFCDAALDPHSEIRSLVPLLKGRADAQRRNLLSLPHISVWELNDSGIRGPSGEFMSVAEMALGRDALA